MSPRTLSKRKARALSERLRLSETPDPADIAMLGEHLIAYNGAMAGVAEKLRSIGLTPTTRLKTSGTIVDKLKRQHHLDLNNIRDLAGARVVQRMSLDDQDEIARKIAGLWPETQPIDRRASPSWGYRAVHLVPNVDGCRVEIQLRTLYQDTWAQVMETFGDTYGRGIRYGLPPDDPDSPTNSGAMTRGQLIETWIGLSDPLHELAELENEMARIRTEESPTPQQRARGEQIQTRIDQEFHVIRGIIQDLAPTFSQGA